MNGLRSYFELVAKVDAQARRSGEALAGRLRCGPGCSDCCRPITVFPVEAVRLAVALRELPASEAEALRDRARQAAGDGPCPLLTEDRRCRLYDARPVICRTQGLPLLVRRDGEAQVTACPLNDLSAGPLPAAAVIDLERLNTILATVNRMFVERYLPDAPERLSIAEALEIEIR